MGIRLAAPLLLLPLIGCAPSQAEVDWRTICASAPYGAGQAYSPSEQRAMTRLNLWIRSVEQVNQDCASR